MQVYRKRVSLSSTPLRSFAAVFVLMALAMRVIIPSGYMPSSERGFALTICAGMDTKTVWMDKSGKLHKEDPSIGKSVEHQPCAFAGAAITADFPATAFQIDMDPVALAAPVFAKREVSIGSGLAAPPPPAIGPPSYA
jgi:hypothetical protein